MSESDWVGTLTVFSSLFGLLCIATLGVLVYKLHSKLKRYDTLIEAMKKDFGVLCAATSRASSRIVQAEKQLSKINERQEQLEMRDPLNHSYGQAIAMAKKGMGVDELVSILGIPRGEAELIVLMHNVKKAS